MTLEETVRRITPLDQEAMEAAEKHWNSIAKPLHSLGKLEDVVVQIAGIQGTSRVEIARKALIVLCADNGVVEEGVTQTGQEVTAKVAENFLQDFRVRNQPVNCRKASFPRDGLNVGELKNSSIIFYPKGGKGCRESAPALDYPPLILV